MGEAEFPWFKTWGEIPTASSYGGHSGVASSGGKGKDKGGGKGGKSEPVGSGIRGPAGRMPEVNLLMDAVSNISSQVLRDPRGFALSCVLPDKFMGGLIGKRG